MEPDALMYQPSNYYWTSIKAEEGGLHLMRKSKDYLRSTSQATWGKHRQLHFERILPRYILHQELLSRRQHMQLKANLDDWAN